MPVIEVTSLHKRYRGQVAVRDVSFTVEQGEIFGILDPNGAGKTTTVECIEGLRTPDSGTIKVLGLDPRSDREELSQRAGVQLQESRVPEKLTVGEALDLYSSFYRTPANWEQLMDTLGLTGKRDTRFAKLSGRQKQRLSIALALVGRPQIAVLDELTTGLDPGARRDTWALMEEIRAQGVTILLVTHLMEEAERLCDRVAVLDSGRVVAIDSPAGLAARVDAEHRIRFRPSRPLGDGLHGVFAADPDFEVVGEAVDGADAIAQVSELRVDVVLMDLRMPEMGGVEAIRLLRQAIPAVRVLVLTTYDTDSNVLPAIEAGATGYLLKDAPRDELIRAVRAAYRGESVLSPSVASRLMGQVRKPAGDALSQREREVLKLIAGGATNREVAPNLHHR
jgi:ABC-2 type transport system ATP-binding protein